MAGDVGVGGQKNSKASRRLHGRPRASEEHGGHCNSAEDAAAIRFNPFESKLEGRGLGLMSSHALLCLVHEISFGKDVREEHPSVASIRDFAAAPQFASTCDMTFVFSFICLSI